MIMTNAYLACPFKQDTYKIKAQKTTAGIEGNRLPECMSAVQHIQNAMSAVHKMHVRV